MVGKYSKKKKQVSFDLSHEGSAGSEEVEQGEESMGIEARSRVPRGAKCGGTEGEGRLGAKNATRMAMVSLGMFVWLHMA